MNANISNIINTINSRISGLSSSELQKLLEELRGMESRARQNEEKEKRRKEEAERKRQEEEAKKRQEEHVRNVTSMDLPLSWENVFYADDRARGLHFDSVPDALIKCLNTLGKVDIEYIAAVTGENCRSVITALKGSIYQNPDTWEECFYKGWETADEYLSGNLKRKLKTAREANRTYDGYFQNNIRALENVLPPAVAADDIFVTLGSPWVPADIIDDFIEHLYSKSRLHIWFRSEEIKKNCLSVKHDELTGSWDIPYKTRYGHSVIDRTSYGTERMETLHVLEKTLNMKTVAVRDEVQTPTGGTRRIVNKAETVLALEKQQKLIREFQSWVWKDPARKERLEAIFENRYSCVRQRRFDGSFLEFPGMDPAISLYPYQRNAVARILFTPNTLLAHDVGSGKTYIMIAAGMELKRMGLSQKNLYVVPNNIVGQWKTMFETAYPNASLLVVTPAGFRPGKRQEVLEMIRDNDYDGIIMPYSCFEQIRLSNREILAQLNDLKKQVESSNADPSKRTNKLAKEFDKIRDVLSELSSAAAYAASLEICFDDLGITRLFVDEAHNYKNLPLDTKVSNVLGISAGGSKKCKDMMEKVRCVQSHGGGVIMATGTPITNSVTDAYVIQKYLQSGELGLLDLQHFDSWIGMFAEQRTEFEIDVDTSGYRMATRFSRFHNLPELSAMLGQIADFHQNDKTNGIPDLDGYSDALIPRTLEFQDFLEEISDRAEKVRHGLVSRRDDNMLLITTDGRKGALDLRLVKPNALFTWQSKVACCAEKVFDIYLKTMDTHSAQLVFCDVSTPKAGFNLYDELRRLLQSMGIPGHEIAYIHDAESEAKKQQLFAKVRQGAVRVLIGSTFKLGLGVNVQDRLIALHHLDVPWRPADMTQREGRILRQGNQNAKVEIFRYITEGSFDAYSWQLLETKQRFITDLLSGSYAGRSGSDIDSTVLNYAEVKALAVGNPLVKKRVETSNELTRLLSLQRKRIETREALEQEQGELPARINRQKETIRAARQDMLYYQDLMEHLPVPASTNEKKQAEDSRRDLRQYLFRSVREYGYRPHEKFLTDYRGFRVILPANMDPFKPAVWLERAGRYRVELGDTEVGGLIRIDHFLDHLSEHIDDRAGRLQKLLDRKRQIIRELSAGENYAERIEELRAELKALDKKLGVKQS